MERSLISMREQRLGAVAILELSGRFDRSTTAPVREWLETVVRPSARVVVDLAAVTFLDSAALATLVQGMKRCRENGGDLRLGGLAQPVRVIFEATRLDRVFRIYGTKADAIRSLEA